MANPRGSRLVISLLAVLGTMFLPATGSLVLDVTSAQFKLLGNSDNHKISSNTTSQRTRKPLLPAMFVLGDSTVDSGNNNDLNMTFFKANFYPYGKDFPNQEATGRFCNGYLSPDYIAERLGLPLALPYFNNKTETSHYKYGVNFASAGSGVLASTSQAAGTIHMQTQVDAYLNSYRERLVDEVGKSKATNILNEAIYIISSGTNDYLNNYITNPVVKASISPDEFQDQMVQSLVSYLELLHGGGARRIAVLSMIPLGCLPSQKSRSSLDDIINGRQCVQELNDFAKDFNSKLEQALTMMQARFTDSIIKLAAIYDTFEDMVKSPAQYGMNHTSGACCGFGLYETAFACNAATRLCDNANQYVFWDSFHPSQQSYKVLSDYLWEKYSAPLLADLPT